MLIYYPPFASIAKGEVFEVFVNTVDAPSLNSFKNRLNKIRSTRMGFFMD